MTNDDVTRSSEDRVDLSIPVRADLVVLARLTAATMASRAEFAVEEIEDLRLAVEELCLSLVRGDGEGRLHLRYTRLDDLVEISCSLEPDGTEQKTPPQGQQGQQGQQAVNELSLRILDALVDEHGRGHDDGHPSAWMRKRRTRSRV